MKPPDAKYITLYRGQRTIVSASDYEELSQYRWFLAARGYVVRKQNGVNVYMARHIMQPPVGMFVDHKDRDKLNNHRSNLRICTKQQNQQNQAKTKRNTSGYRGVTLHRPTGKWEASCGRVDGYIGLFESREDAARAYNEVAKARHGEFAVLNEVRI